MSDSKPRPSFLFIDNALERMVTLRRTKPGDHPKGQPPPQESTMIGRGLNYVRAEYADANKDMGTLGCSVVDPCKIPDGDVARVLQRCTSRQAMIEWSKLEKRARVVEQIKARLSRGPSASADDESASAEA